MKKLFYSVLTTLLFLMAGVSAHADDWVGTWATAPEFTGPGDMPQHAVLTDNAIRQIVHVSIGGDMLRLQLSNEFSREPVEIRSIYIANTQDSTAIDVKSVRYLTFNGKRNVTIEGGKALFSDELRYALKPLQRLTITINYGQTPQNATSHRGSRTTSYIMKGESKPKKAFVVEEALDHWYNIAAIDVKADHPTCWAVIGNSITDGRGTTTNLQNRWTDVCAEAMDGKVSILNLGIGGNCVLRGGLSEPALKRFDRDIMGQRGTTGIVIYEGINDIGGSRSVEKTEKELIEAYELFIGKARAAGLKVVGATITPIGNTMYWSHYHEALRQTINEWIRTSGKFDAVIDFDKVLSDPQRPTWMRADFQYDWLHPNAAGYKAMGLKAAEVLSDKSLVLSDK
jgi:lysophospholipase L1-like esterase